MKNFTTPYFQLKSSVKNDGLFWIVWAEAILIFYFEGIFKWHFQKDCSIFCRIKNANPSQIFRGCVGMIRRCDTSSLNMQLLQLEQSQLSAFRADSSNISYQHFLNLFYKQQKPTKFLLYSYVCALAKKSSPPPQHWNTAVSC